MDSRYRFLTLGTPWTQSMPSCDVNAVTRLAEASWRRDNTIKPEMLRILHHDIWGTVSVFIVDLNADIRGGFTNLTADYQKLRLEIGVGI